MSEDMKQTPGPWRIAGQDHDLDGYKITDIGPTQDHDGDGASEYIATVYDLGNAPLVAAAPDLVEALIEIASRAGVDRGADWAALRAKEALGEHPRADNRAAETGGGDGLWRVPALPNPTP